jgi:hypothetical protein
LIATESTRVVETIEREISCLRRARPHLATRIERAEHIIVTQLSTSNGTRPVKVRIHADGSRSYTVRSCSKLRRVYTVRGGTLECDCPDARRLSETPPACKHGIACFVLDRVLVAPRPVNGHAPRTSLCSGCGERVPSGELTEVQDYHESLSYFEGDTLCAGCFAGSDCW